MAAVNFVDGDAWLLWPIPKAGCDLEHILHVYVFIARDAVPQFGRVRDCLSRASRAGVLLPPTGGRFELAPLWAARFSEIVESHSPTECGIMELDEFLLAGEWPEVAADFSLEEGDYRCVAGVVERHNAILHGSRQGTSERAEPHGGRY
jgi:hypothetical protein